MHGLAPWQIALLLYSFIKSQAGSGASGIQAGEDPSARACLPHPERLAAAARTRGRLFDIRLCTLLGPRQLVVQGLSRTRCVWPIQNLVVLLLDDAAVSVLQCSKTGVCAANSTSI